MTFLRRAGAFFLIALGLLTTFFIGLWIFGSWHDEWSGFNASLEYSDGWCNIAVIPLVGEVVPYSAVEDQTSGDDVLASLRKAQDDTDIKGVLLRIDSGGGSGSASEMIAKALKDSPLPSVALIRSIGTSAAYLAATGADTIIASEFADVGGIGVTMSYLENVKQNEKEGLDFVSLASAPFKDYGNPNAPLTAAERELLERDLDTYHAAFVRQVAENRGMTLEKVEVLADGASLPSLYALGSGLIDLQGTQEDARSWYADKLGLAPEEVVFCE